MILLIDNYDSFSYNVYQLVGSVNPDIRVIRNDECSVDEIRTMNPSTSYYRRDPADRTKRVSVKM